MNPDNDVDGCSVVETKRNEVEKRSARLAGSRKLALNYLIVLILYSVTLVSLPCGSTQAVDRYDIEEESRSAQHRPLHR